MAIYRGGQKIKELRFGGSQKIKEAYVGSQLVFKSGWDPVPDDGVMFTRDGAFVSYSGIKYLSSSKRWTISGGETGTISNIVFGKNTTEINLTSATSGSGFEISIDGESIGSTGSGTTATLNIPAKFIDGNEHTITLRNRGSSFQNFTTFNFNV